MRNRSCFILLKLLAGFGAGYSDWCRNGLADGWRAMSLLPWGRALAAWLIAVIVACMEYEDEMPLLIVQLAILIAVAFVVGCFLGRILRRRKSAGSDHERTIVAAALSTPPLAEKAGTCPASRTGQGG